MGHGRKSIQQASVTLSLGWRMRFLHNSEASLTHFKVELLFFSCICCDILGVHSCKEELKKIKYASHVVMQVWTLKVFPAETTESVGEYFRASKCGQNSVRSPMTGDGKTKRHRRNKNTIKKEQKNKQIVMDLDLKESKVSKGNLKREEKGEEEAGIWGSLKGIKKILSVPFASPFAKVLDPCWVWRNMIKTKLICEKH